VDKQSKQDVNNILERARSVRFRSDAVLTPIEEVSTYPVEEKYMKQFVFAVTRRTGWPGDNYPVTLAIYTDYAGARRVVNRKKKENKNNPSEPKFSITSFEVRQ
jgi:hypothetical protein